MKRSASKVDLGQPAEPTHAKKPSKAKTGSNEPCLRIVYRFNCPTGNFDPFDNGVLFVGEPKFNNQFGYWGIMVNDKADVIKVP